MYKLPHYQKLGLARNEDTEISTRLIREDQIGTKTKQNSHNKPSKSSSIYINSHSNPKKPRTSK